MQLFVGLGNPGVKYVKSRHNLGFLVVEQIAKCHDFQAWRNRHHGIISRGLIEKLDIFLLKPTTFMNRSGVSVADVIRFYKINISDVTVFYDEIDLTPGKIRIKTGGGAAGHNGIRSIANHIGDGFRRVRIGIGHPGEKEQVESHVLSDFYRQEMTWVEPLVDAISSASAALVTGDESGFLNRINVETNPNQKSQKTPLGRNRGSSSVGG